MAAQKKKEKALKEIRQICRLYSESFLRRMLRLIEVFTSVAALEWGDKEKPTNIDGCHILELLEKVATPAQIATLLKLLVYSSPRSKIIVLRILENLTRVNWKPEIFDKGVELFVKDKESYGYDLMYKINPTWKIEGASFLTFIHHYLLTIRLKIWAKSSMESQG
jgi:hypothetical protein